MNLRDVSTALSGTTPPAEYRTHHDDMVEIIDEILAAEPEFVAAVATNAPTDQVTGEMFWGPLEQAAEEAGISSLFDEFDDACERLELAAFARGARNGICPPG